MTVHRITRLLVVVILAALCSQSNAQLPTTPVPPPPTLWSFLGIPQTAQRVTDSMANRFGNRPRLERTPPLKAIADPANLESEVPAIKQAAKVKQAEDLAPQKIKAIKYLGKMGCGCYDKGGEITKALIASMEDCTEDVRLAAVETIKEGAQGGCCQYCNQKSCCSPDVTEALAKLAYEMNDEGCPIEPSERVRQAAVEALTACCPATYDYYEPEPDVIPESGGDPIPVEGDGSTEEEEESILEDPAVPTPDMDARRSSRRGFIQQASMVSASMSDRQEPTLANPVEFVKAEGEPAVVFVDREKKTARLHFPLEGMDVTPGTKFQVYQPVEGKGYKLAGEFEVLEQADENVTIRPIGDWDVASITHDSVIVGP